MKEWRGFTLMYAPDGTLQSALTFDAENFLRDGAELERLHHPPRLALGKADPHLAKLVTMPELANKHELTLFGKIGDTAASILGAARLAVRALVLDECGLSAEGVRALLPLAPQLERLSLARNDVGDDGAALLAGAPFAVLRSLGLWDTKLHDAGAVALARSPHLHLRELDLRKNELRVETGRALAESPWTNELEILRLGQTNLYAGVAAVAHLRSPGPVDLDLCACLIESESAIAALAAAPWKRLVRIGLSDNRIPSERMEDALDYDGTLVGRGPAPLTKAELAERFGFTARGVTVY